jgi:MFS family permease
MSGSSDGPVARDSGTFEPLREPVFRRIWTASLFSNFGQLILGVGAAWEMTRLTSSPSMVALVQTAMMLPLVLVAVPAGALADMFDRRKIAMLGLGFSIICSILLTCLALFGYTSPWLLLVFCSLIGAGVALFAPAWQASIGEQVTPQQLPAAIALGTISFNVARSIGPALGGLIVLAAGAQAAFALNALCYLPLFFAFFIWKRLHTPSRLPPERIDRAIVSGARYAFHSRPIRTVLIRAFLFGLVGATAVALGPLIARDLLGGDASTYGILLGSSGVGAVSGAFLVSALRDRFGDERASGLLLFTCGLGLILIGFSHSLALTCFGMFIIGGSNILNISLFNITVQLSAPRWVTARALSLFSASLTGGIAVGAAFWGAVASAWSVDLAIAASGAAMLAMPLLAFVLPLSRSGEAGVEPVQIRNEPEVAMALTMRSGPIIIEIDYRVDPDKARAFYDVMLDLQRVRLRNGGFDWSLARDIADPAQWTERYHCPTWGDYLRMRDRMTQADMAAQVAADAFLLPGDGKRVRRRLERPFGSVRWHADSPDVEHGPIGYMGP